LHEANKSTIAATAIELISQLYGIEREVKDLSHEQRLHERRTRAAPIAKELHDWLIAQRTKITHGTATAKSIDYSLNRRAALTRYPDDPVLPIDNGNDKQQIQPRGDGPQELALCRDFDGRATCRGDHGLDPVGQAQLV
jgi:transposase